MEWYLWFIVTVCTKEPTWKFWFSFLSSVDLALSRQYEASLEVFEDTCGAASCQWASCLYWCMALLWGQRARGKVLHDLHKTSCGSCLPISTAWGVSCFQWSLSFMFGTPTGFTPSSLYLSCPYFSNLSVRMLWESVLKALLESK